MSETVTESSTSPNTLVNALIGGIASILLAFLPFSPVVGGGIAGYLEGPDRSRGLRVGAYAGVVAAVPFVLVALLGVSVFTFSVVPVTTGPGMGPGTGPGSMGGGLPVFGILALLVVFAVAVLYSVGLSALGGYLGAYLKTERVGP
jgi:hypothetical protein